MFHVEHFVLIVLYVLLCVYVDGNWLCWFHLAGKSLVAAAGGSRALAAEHAHPAHSARKGGAAAVT